MFWRWSGNGPVLKYAYFKTFSYPRNINEWSGRYYRLDLVPWCNVRVSSVWYPRPLPPRPVCRLSVKPLSISRLAPLPKTVTNEQGRGIHRRQIHGSVPISIIKYTPTWLKPDFSACVLLGATEESGKSGYCEDVIGDIPPFWQTKKYALLCQCFL